MASSIGRALGLWLAGLACALPAWAGGIAIGPLSLEIGPRARIAVLGVTNRGTAPIDLQAEALAWSQAGATDALEPTDEIVVSPAIATVPPGKEQLFRVAVRRPLPPGAEQAFRVVVSDVSDPEAADAASGSGGAPAVQFRLAHSIPLYVQTLRSGQPELGVEPCPAAGNAVCVRVRNEGTRRAVVRRVTLQGGGWAHELATGTVVLAGGARTFTVPAGAARGARLAVHVDAGDASVSGVIDAGSP